MMKKIEIGLRLHSVIDTDARYGIRAVKSTTRGLSTLLLKCNNACGEKPQICAQPICFVPGRAQDQTPLLSYRAKRGMKSHRAFCLLKSPLLQLHGHECLIRHIVFAPESKRYRGSKSEAGIVIRMPQDDHGVRTEAATRLESSSSQISSGGRFASTKSDKTSSYATLSDSRSAIRKCGYMS